MSTGGVSASASASASVGGDPRTLPKRATTAPTSAMLILLSRSGGEPIHTSKKSQKLFGLRRPPSAALAPSSCSSAQPSSSSSGSTPSHRESVSKSEHGFSPPTSVGVAKKSGLPSPSWPEEL